MENLEYRKWKKDRVVIATLSSISIVFLIPLVILLIKNVGLFCFGSIAVILIVLFFVYLLLNNLDSSIEVYQKIHGFKDDDNNSNFVEVEPTITTNSANPALNKHAQHQEEKKIITHVLKKNLYFITFILVLLAVLIRSWAHFKLLYSNPDRDNAFETIDVSNNNTWMKSLLKVSTFKNGDSILLCQDENSWSKACENQIPAYCTSSDNSIYYYNMSCIIDKRGIAPEGFKLPTSKEIEELLASYFIYHPQSTMIQGFNDPTWQFMTEIHAKTKFDIFPSGARLGSDDFEDIQSNNTYLWTSTSPLVDGKNGSLEYFKVNLKDVFEGWSKENSWQTWSQGFPILCLKGSSHGKDGKLIIEEKKSSSKGFQ